MKYGNTINLIILMKLLKGKYTSLYTAIHVSKQFSFIMIFMFPNNFNVYFSFNNIDIILQWKKRVSYHKRHICLFSYTILGSKLITMESTSEISREMSSLKKRIKFKRKAEKPKSSFVTTPKMIHTISLRKRLP